MKGQNMSKKGYPKHHKPRRLPFEPLLSMFHDELSDRQIAEAIRRSRQTVYQWKMRGIPQYEADEVACLIGVHPSHIWGEQWWQSISIR